MFFVLSFHNILLPYMLVSFLTYITELNSFYFKNMGLQNKIGPSDFAKFVKIFHFYLILKIGVTSLNHETRTVSHHDWIIDKMF